MHKGDEPMQLVNSNKEDGAREILSKIENICRPVARVATVIVVGLHGYRYQMHSPRSGDREREGTRGTAHFCLVAIHSIPDRSCLVMKAVVSSIDVSLTAAIFRGV